MREAKTGKGYLACRDVLGRPVIVAVARLPRITSRVLDESKKHCVEVF